MGFYDHRCALTGLSLWGQSCDLILLRQQGKQVRPIWGCVTGEYNRLGTIDDPRVATDEIAHLRAALDALARDGRLVETGDAPYPHDSFFERFEPNRHRVLLDGDEIVRTLVHHRVAEHLVREHGDERETFDATAFARVFAPTTPLAPFAPVGLDRGLRRLRALQTWLGSKPFPLLPLTAEQHVYEDAVRSIRDAKKRAPRLIEAIEAAAQDYRR